MSSLKQQLRIAENELDNNKINHILHLVLSIVTGGLWLIVWALIVMSKPSDASIIAKIDKLKDKMEEQIENQKYKKVYEDEIVAWDIIDGFQHYVYHEYMDMRTAIYVGCDACDAEKEFEDAVKYFGGQQ